MKPIEVQMFGSFSMKYEDRLITGKAKTSESQFNYLMQLLIHAGAEGVPKNVLISTIFGGRDLNNPNHAVHSVIYNAKKHLETFGIPAKNAIYQKDGVYYWNEELPVEEDARRFEELAVRAAETSDRSEAIQLYMDAIHLYVGDFLESGTSNPWIAKESYRYRKLFTKTVTETADLLRLTGQYLVMEDLGKFAAKVHPFSDWETLTMEAYVAEGKAEEANALFEKTVELYLNEQGIRPSNRLFGLVNTLSDQIEHRHGLLDDIQAGLVEEPEENGGGGYRCSYPVFLGIYRAVDRILERNGQTAYLMLCTIVDSKGNTMQKSERLEEFSRRLGDAIEHTIRRSDIMCRYSAGQYLVMLMNTTLENCSVVQKRINREFIVNRQRISVKYFVNSIM